jgi:hypothetical protein
MTESRDRSTPSRRDFLRLAAAAGLAGALAPAAALAQATPPPATPPTLPPTAPPAPEPLSEAAKAFTSVLQQRLGNDRLTDAQWESVTRDFDGDFAAGKRLAGIKLANGDEPDFAFKVTP